MPRELSGGFAHLFAAFGQFDYDRWTSLRVLSKSVLTSNWRTWVWRERLVVTARARKSCNSAHVMETKGTYPFLEEPDIED